MPARFLRCALALAPLLAPLLAQAQVLPAVTSSPAAGGGTQWSLSIQTLLLLTSLTFLPALLLMMTSFTRIIIVLSLLRHALAHCVVPRKNLMHHVMKLQKPWKRQLLRNSVNVNQIASLRQMLSSGLQLFWTLQKFQRHYLPQCLPQRVPLAGLHTSLNRSALVA